MIDSHKKRFSQGGANPPADDYTPQLENRYVNLVEERSGIVFDDVKRRELKTNIAVCMEECGEKSYQRYFEQISIPGYPGNGCELKRLINFITINETFFFRVEEHFDILARTVVPRLLEYKRANRDEYLNVWSAGASSGEEVYSLIINLLETPRARDNFRIKVLGTDINEDMLYIAEKGIYSGRTLNKVSPYILEKYFEPFRDRYRVKDEVKQYARLRYLNLMDPLDTNFLGRLDIIFFRNVLIYFSKENTKRIIESFYHLLKDEGYLFLGPSETLWDISDRFELMMFDRAYIYRKKAGSSGTVIRDGAGIRSVTPVSRPTMSDFRTPAPPEPEPAPLENLAVPPVRSEPEPVPLPLAGAPDDAADFPSVDNKLRLQEEEVELMIQLGDYSKAEEVLEDLLRLETRGKPVMLLKLTLLSNQSREPELLSFSREALKVFPIFPELHFVLGRFFESVSNWKEAEKEYRKVLFLHQDYVLPRAGLLRVLLRRGDSRNAGREARNILEQLETSHHKIFEHPVGEEFDKERLARFCREALR